MPDGTNGRKNWRRTRGVDGIAGKGEPIAGGSNEKIKKQRHAALLECDKVVLKAANEPDDFAEDRYFFNNNVIHGRVFRM